MCEPSRHGGERFAAAERTHTAPHGVWLHGDGLRPVFAHGRPDAEPGTARTTAMTQRVRALTAMAAGDEPNTLRLWSARTQNHAVRGFGDRLNTSPTESSAPQRHRQHHMYNT